MIRLEDFVVTNLLSSESQITGKGRVVIGETPSRAIGLREQMNFYIDNTKEVNNTLHGIRRHFKKDF